MSKYTTEVRYICESLAGKTESAGFDDIDDIIEAAIPHIFSFDFPIFDENYREVICTKILRHYYTREIGLETYGLWKLKLQTKLNEIMPYYNKLYQSELYKFNPLYDTNLTTINTGSRTGENTNINKENGVTTEHDARTNTSSGSRNADSKMSNVNSENETDNNSKTTRDLYSDTPQGALTGVENESYLTNARKITDSGNASKLKNNVETGSTEQSITDENTETSVGENSRVDSKEVNSREVSKNTEDYVTQVIGKVGGTSYAKMIREFRDNLLNIDLDIIRDLADLFMLIW